MSVAIYTKNIKQSTKWLNVLNEDLPNHKIEIYPDISDFKSIEMLLCWKPYKGLIDKFQNLKAIQSFGAGVDHIFDENDVDPSIQVSKIVDHQLSHDMWEHVLGVVMADMKNLSIYESQQLNNIWKPKRYKRFKDTSIGILGLGAIGSYVATQFAKLGFEVLGWSRSKKTLENVTSYVGKDGLNSVVNKVDYLINILPLTTQSTGILNHDLFSKMKPSSYLINVGRGGHLKDNDLIESLDNDKIRGASLDVFHAEPLDQSHDFWAHPKILITPHIASLTHIDSVYPQIVENIKRLASGLPLFNLVDVVKEY